MKEFRHCLTERSYRVLSRETAPELPEARLKEGNVRKRKAS